MPELLNYFALYFRSPYARILFRYRTGVAELYQALNGMPLREMDWIVNPVCALCRDHERNGFIHGVQVGI